jgi:hypothetical protein
LLGGSLLNSSEINDSLTVPESSLNWYGNMI